MVLSLSNKKKTMQRSKGEVTLFLSTKVTLSKESTLQVGATKYRKANTYETREDRKSFLYMSLAPSSRT